MYEYLMHNTRNGGKEERGKCEGKKERRQMRVEV
jgi:hypothetical protein